MEFLKSREEAHFQKDRLRVSLKKQIHLKTSKRQTSLMMILSRH